MDVGDQQASRAESDGGEQREFDAVEVGKDPQAWTIALTEHEVRGRSGPKRSSFTIGRDSLLAKLSIVDGIFAPHCLSIKNPKVLLRLDPDGFRALKDWVGQHLLLQGVLKQRLGWALPIGILFLLGSLPVEADVAAGIDAIPFDVFSALMGGFLLMQGAAAQKWPHPFFLLLDSVWFASLAVSSVLDIVGGASVFWGLGVMLQLWLVYTGLRDWNKFRQQTY